MKILIKHICIIIFLFKLSLITHGQGGSCPLAPPGYPQTPLISFDPNEIIGTSGYGNENYIPKRAYVNYAIYCENHPDSATGAAQEIWLIDTLDRTKFNVKDFSFGTFTFRNITIEATPGVTAFTKDVDMREYGQENIIIRITATFDTATGIVRCHFIAYDPVTMDLTENPFLGILYPNTEPPIGEGNITYRIGLLPSVTHGDIIENQAHIIFDLNEPIATNIFINTIDTISPNTTMSYAASGINHSTYIISWGGSDAGSGVRDYTVYMSENDGEYFVWQYNTTATFDTLIGNIDSTYKFYCIASDNVGNREDKKEYDIRFTMESTLSVLERGIGNSHIRIYPNPTENTFSIQSSSTIEQISIYDISGRILQTFEVSKTSKVLDISHLANGIYLVKVKTEEGEVIQKIVKQ
jgi:hypothetical protein